MNVFLSWSGDVSKEIGKEFKNWLPSVLQAVKPYYTPNDIDKGTRWASEISKKLHECDIGIFFLTKENLNSTWMHFEAGAISKGYQTSKVCSILFGIDNSEIKGPFSQYQSSQFSREEIFKLVKTINNGLEVYKLDDDVLNRVFDKFWMDLKEKVIEILTTKKVTNKNVRKDRDILEEILSISRFTLKTQESILNNDVTSTKDKDYLAGKEYEKLNEIKRQLEKLEQFEIISEHIRQADFLLDKDAKKALIIYDKALKINQFHEPALIGKAKAYRRLKKLDKAIEILNGIAQRNPKCERAFYNMACYKNLSKDYKLEEAISDLKKSIELHPNYKDYAVSDTDFENLRTNLEFKKLTKGT